MALAAAPFSATAAAAGRCWRSRASRCNAKPSRIPAPRPIATPSTASDRFALLGPSGRGKSSLLKGVDGFPPVEGSSRLDGCTVDRPGPDRMMALQEFDQLPQRKPVKQSVTFPMLASGRCSWREAAERAEILIAKVGGFGDVHPTRRSGVMKQRVATAHAMAIEAAMLLMEEPFAALTRGKMQDELLQLPGDIRGTVLFVTRSIEEAVIVGSRILRLPPPRRARFVHLREQERARDRQCLRRSLHRDPHRCFGRERRLPCRRDRHPAQMGDAAMRPCR